MSHQNHIFSLTVDGDSPIMVTNEKIINWILKTHFSGGNN